MREIEWMVIRLSDDEHITNIDMTIADIMAIAKDGIILAIGHDEIKYKIDHYDFKLWDMDDQVGKESMNNTLTGLVASRSLVEIAIHPQATGSYAASR